MNSKTKSLPGSALVFSVVAGVAIVLSAIGYLYIYRLTLTASLKDVLTFDGCTSTCWRGIEAEVTTTDRLVEILLRDQVDFSTNEVGDVVYYDWTLDSTSSQLSPGSSDITLSAMTGDGFVGTLSIGGVHVCLSTVVSAYGEPRSVVEFSPGSFTLAYPDESLIFQLVDERNYVHAITLRSKEVIVEEFVQRAYPPYPQSWEEVKDTLLSGQCKDDFQP